MDNLNLEVSDLLCANCAQVNIRDVGDLIGSDGLRCLVDLVGNALGCRCTVGEVVLDAKVFLGT